MERVAEFLWIIPALPLLAAAAIALMRRRHRRPAATLAIGSLVLAFVASCVAFAATLRPAAGEGLVRLHHDFAWFEVGGAAFRAGWLLDPLSAGMLVMVTFVGSLIFVFSVGYMAHDANFTRFFGFLSLFAAAMLGLLVANNLLVLFMCWELVGLASYLLIGFWFSKPEAATAAKKAFIATRIGDLGFLIGIVWLHHATGSLLFYDDGAGCLEQGAIARLVAATTVGGMAVSTAISLLLFCGAIGKSGQLPLHVWLPDAMEGPTPVSALIHAATMVAAGVFLVARVYPLMAASPAGTDVGAGAHAAHTTALAVVTWVGALTAVFGALVAVAQDDIKRILAYSTISQLGYMMMGLGTGGPAVGMLHLVVHAFFKALLFLGAGSVIHGCGGEQDIRRMGGLRRAMPVTFATYAVGMMALSGFPLVFSGFWSKDAILHAAMVWEPSRIPFVLGLCGAALTAFYMTRQMWFVFFAPRVGTPHGEPHESPGTMTVPLVVLAAATVLLAVPATPAWPWFHAYLAGHLDELHAGWNAGAGVVAAMAWSILAVAVGVAVSWRLYSRTPAGTDAIEIALPRVFRALRARLYVDEFYAATFHRLARWASLASDWADRFFWGTIVDSTAWIARGVAWVGRVFDNDAVDAGFDAGCEGTRGAGKWASRIQNGQTQRYLRLLAAGIVAIVAVLAWSGTR